MSKNIRVTPFVLMYISFMLLFRHPLADELIYTSYAIIVPLLIALSGVIYIAYQKYPNQMLVEIGSFLSTLVLVSFVIIQATKAENIYFLTRFSESATVLTEEVLYWIASTLFLFSNLKVIFSFRRLNKGNE